MNTGRQGAKLLILLFLITALAGIGEATFASAIPVDVSGSIGYNFRSLKGPAGRDTVDNQVLGTLNLSSYIWRPWLATTQLRLTGTYDNSNYNQDSARANSKIFTGQLILNALPRSRTPFQLNYTESDSRLSNFSVQDPLVTYKDEFKIKALRLKQSYLTDSGNRYQAFYSTQHYDSHKTGKFVDDKYGITSDVRLPRHHILGNANYETISQSPGADSTQVLDKNYTDKAFFNVSHFWYPTEALRVDSHVSYYNTKVDTRLPPQGSNYLQNEDQNIAQLTSFVFWRPVQQPLSLSGGIRIFDARNSASTGGINNSLHTFNFSATAGGIYQYTKNLRFNGNFGASQSNSENSSVLTTQERGGALYQSDIVDLKGFNYQWFTDFNAASTNTTGGGGNVQNTALTLSHDIRRAWSTGQSSMLSMSLSQSLSEDYQSNIVNASHWTHYLTHSGYLTWNQSAWNGTTSVRLTLSDARDIANMANQQQLENFQATRTQQINRRSTLTGNLTLTNVHQSYLGHTGESNVTTASGRVNFNYRQLFGIPELQYVSYVYYAAASRSHNNGRGQWDNRLKYTIGQLYASFDYRFIRTGGETFDLIYVQVARHF